MISLKKISNLREYHRILGSLLYLRKSGSIVTELLNPLSDSELLTNDEAMTPVLVEKYGSLFCSAENRAQFEIGNISPVSHIEVQEMIRS